MKQAADEFIKEHISARSNLLECDYFIINRLKLYGCSLKWWGLPEGREHYNVHSTGLKSNNSDKLRGKVDNFLQKKVKSKDLICFDYYTWGASFINDCHHARITYYLKK